jgi:hypothetical protein
MENEVTTEKWTADPKRGAEFLEPRRAEIVAALESAADVAFAALDEKLAGHREAAQDTFKWWDQ